MRGWYFTDGHGKGLYIKSTPVGNQDSDDQAAVILNMGWIKETLYHALARVQMESISSGLTENDLDIANSTVSLSMLKLSPSRRDHRVTVGQSFTDSRARHHNSSTESND